MHNAYSTRLLHNSVIWWAEGGRNVSFVRTTHFYALNIGQGYAVAISSLQERFEQLIQIKTLFRILMYTDFAMMHLPHHIIESTEISKDTTSKSTTRFNSETSTSFPTKQSTTMTREKKTVTFAKRGSWRRTIHINEYTNEEIQATWYSRLEKKQIKEEIRVTVHLMSKGLLSRRNIDNAGICTCGDYDETHYSTRGIEYYTRKLSTIKIQNKRIALDTVLDEQAYQRAVYKSCDPVKLAEVYKEATHESKVIASLIGLSDEKIAERLQNHHQQQHQRRVFEEQLHHGTKKANQQHHHVSSRSYQIRK